MKRPSATAARCAVLCGALVCVPVFAQRLAWADVAMAEASAGGFGLRQVDLKTADAASDVQRLSEKGAWEKVFAALEQVQEAEAGTMIAVGQSGLLIPAQRWAAEQLIVMPAEGRAAFRLFHDAAARQVWEQALAADTEASEEQLLRRIVDRYFITEVGDQAADRLGDLLFERGEFAGALRQWTLLLEHHADSELSEPKLQVKRALALHRLGRLEEVSQLHVRLARRFEGQRVTIGGQEVEAAAFVASLLSPDTATPTAASAPAAAALPESETPTWQFQLIGEAARLAQRQAGRNWGGRYPMLGMIPPIESDQKRLYVNLLGVVMAFDLRSGKMLWRSTAMSTLNGQWQQIPYNVDPERYALVRAEEDALLEVSLPPDRINHYPQVYELVRRETTTGKEVWRTRKGKLEKFSFTGQPVVDQGVIYAAGAAVEGHNQSSGVLELLALDVRDGSELWRLGLGTPAAGQNRRGQPALPVVTMRRVGSGLLVLTNNGCLLSVSLADRAIDWAWKFESPPPANPQMWMHNPGMARPVELPASMMLHAGVLYAKESRSRLLLALDPAEPRLLWTRPVPRGGALIDVDPSRMTLLGEDVSAIDMESRKLLWATPLPSQGASPGWVRVGEHWWVLSARGIQAVDAQTGQAVRLFRGADLGAAGGHLRLAGDQLLCVSNQRITVYPLRATEP